MTVWVENPFDHLPGDGGRPGRYEMMCRAFAARGHRVVWWSSDFDHATKRYRAQPAGGLPFETRLVPTPRYDGNVSPGRIRSHRAYAKEWLKMALGCGERPDLLIVSVPPLSTGGVALELKRRFDCRLVADMQDAWPETFYRLLPRDVRFLGKVAFAGAHRAMRRLSTGADLVTGVCDRYEPLALSYGARGYYRARLGIALPPVAATGGRRAAARPPFRLAYVGHVGPTYDLRTVVKALELLPGSTLEIAGAIEDRRFASDRVHFHGYLTGGRLSDFLASCHVGIVPMSDDSFVGIPNKLADYASHSLPIVSSLGGECAELIARYGCGARYRPGDARSLADAVLSLRSDAGARARLMAERELDASAIYADYVSAVERGCRANNVV